MSNGCSGMRITLAPPAMPACRAIQPAWRPITSTTSDAVVRLGGGVQPVDRLHRDVDRGVEAEGEVGGAEVVVDRLRHADDVARRGRCSLVATPRVSSPPIAISASTPCSARLSLIRSTPPSTLNGLVREEPRIVPPRGRMPRTSVDAERAWSGPPAGPASRRGSRRTRGRSSSTPLRTTARITAFRPGQSPPPVSTPMRMICSSSRNFG